MPGRIETLKDADVIKKLVKCHIAECPSKSSRLWMHKTNDELCEEFSDFLTAVAKTGLRVGVQGLVSALKDQFEGKPSILHTFSKQIVDASAWSRQKVRQIHDGSKTEPGLLAIVKAWGWTPTLDDKGTSSMDRSADPLEASGLSAVEVLEQSDSSEVEVLEDRIAEDRPSEEADLAKSIQMRALSSFAKDAAATTRKLTPCLTLSSDDGPPAKKAKVMHIVTHACARMRSVL